MSKFTNYLLMICGVMLLFYFMGLMDKNTISGSLLSALLDPVNISFSTFSGKALTALAGIAATGILVGLTFQNAQSGIMATYAASLLAFLWDFTSVFNRVAGAFGSLQYVLALLIFSPFFVLLVVTVIEFWNMREG